MAPSCLNATGIGIRMPSICLLLAIITPFGLRRLRDLLVSIAHPIFEFHPGIVELKKMLTLIKNFQEVAMAEKNPVVLMSTSMGNFRIEVDATNAPISSKNFVDYVNSGDYDGVIFHRG